MTEQLKISDTDPTIGLPHLAVAQAMPEQKRQLREVSVPTMEAFLLLQRRVSDLESVVMALSEPWWKRMATWVKELFNLHG